MFPKQRWHLILVVIAVCRQYCVGICGKNYCACAISSCELSAHRKIFKSLSRSRHWDCVSLSQSECLLALICKFVLRKLLLSLHKGKIIASHVSYGHSFTATKFLFIIVFWLQSKSLFSHLSYKVHRFPRFLATKYISVIIFWLQSISPSSYFGLNIPVSLFLCCKATNISATKYLDYKVDNLGETQWFWPFRCFLWVFWSTESQRDNLNELTHF